jgi:hypothetical protein
MTIGYFSSNNNGEPSIATITVTKVTKLGLEVFTLHLNGVYVSECLSFEMAKTKAITLERKLSTGVTVVIKGV